MIVAFQCTLVDYRTTGTMTTVAIRAGTQPKLAMVLDYVVFFHVDQSMENETKTLFCTNSDVNDMIKVKSTSKLV